MRFIQLYHRGWDHHGGIEKGVKVTADLVDKGTAALVKDLKQRGMLNDTLVIWGGEFGANAHGTGQRPRIITSWDSRVGWQAVALSRDSIGG